MCRQVAQVHTFHDIVGGIVCICALQHTATHCNTHTMEVKAASKRGQPRQGTSMHACYWFGGLHLNPKDTLNNPNRGMGIHTLNPGTLGATSKPQPLPPEPRIHTEPQNPRCSPSQCETRSPRPRRVTEVWSGSHRGPRHCSADVGQPHQGPLQVHCCSAHML